jgi:hypothetical protein
MFTSVYSSKVTKTWTTFTVLTIIYRKQHSKGAVCLTYACLLRFTYLISLSIKPRSPAPHRDALSVHYAVRQTAQRIVLNCRSPPASIKAVWLSSRKLSLKMDGNRIIILNNLYYHSSIAHLDMDPYHHVARSGSVTYLNEMDPDWIWPPRTNSIQIHV